MTSRDSRSKAAADLRQKAEALAREGAARMPEDSAALSPEDIRNTVHELRVHQIELEMQNEELRTAKVEIEESQARYFDLYDLAPVGYCTLSEHGLILEANLTTATLLNVNRNALVKQPISRFIHKEDQDIYYLHRRELFETGGAQECELRLVKPDGSSFWAHLTATAAEAEDGAPVCRVVISDINERKLAGEIYEKLQAQLMQAQKMEAVGTLAGGVAHDFNNLLQAMMTQVQLLRLSKADPSRVERVIGELEQQALHGASLTRQLLLFSRRETATPELLDLGRVVQNSAGMLRRLLPENIVFSADCAAERLVVLSDPGQLQQLMANLVVNASQAMPHGGSLRIRTAARSSALAVLEVEDSGHGIPEKIRSSIFEPFFTTKTAEQGTGLGLAVVHGIVTGNGGAIEVDSQVGKGTTFRVLLPRREDSDLEGDRGDGDWTGDLQRGHGERILLVEDEKAAREGLREILTALGYQVTAVGSAEEAGLLPAEPVFELLFTDLVLPGAHGPELAQSLVERWPGLKVILMSGHTEDHAVRRGAADGTLRFLQKPFDMDTLAREIRAALTES